MYRLQEKTNGYDLEDSDSGYGTSVCTGANSVIGRGLQRGSLSSGSLTRPSTGEGNVTRPSSSASEWRSYTSSRRINRASAKSNRSTVDSDISDMAVTPSVISPRRLAYRPISTKSVIKYPDQLAEPPGYRLRLPVGDSGGRESQSPKHNRNARNGSVASLIQRHEQMYRDQPEKLLNPEADDPLNDVSSQRDVGSTGRDQNGNLIVSKPPSAIRPTSSPITVASHRYLAEVKRETPDANWQKEMCDTTEVLTRRRKTNHASSMDSAHMMVEKMKNLSPSQIKEREVLGTGKAEESEVLRIGKARRDSRERPWRRGSSAGRSRKYTEIHYEKTVPPSKWVECTPKKYVTNHKYGTHFEVRLQSKKAKTPKPGTSFLWENNCQVWLMDNLNEVNFERKSQLDQAREQREAELERQRQPRPKTAPVTAREITKSRAEWRRKLHEAEDKSNVFEQFVEWSMGNQRMRTAVVVVQKYTRGWKVRNKIKQLSARCIKHHGGSWKKITSEYKSLLERCQRRCGVQKPSRPFSIQHFEKYLTKKQAYESIFHKLAPNGSLPRPLIMQLFRDCALFPLQREVDTAFNAVFKGCGTQADAVFLLDCSASVGRIVYELQLGIIKDIVGHCDVAYDKVRVAVVPYNDDVFRVIDFDSYGTVDELQNELDELTFEKVREYGQITRTDLALKSMIQIMEKALNVNDHIRDGSRVPKLCIAFTDGKCYHTQLTEKWARLAREKFQVELHLVNCTDTEPDGKQFLDITADSNRVYKLSDYQTLRTIKTIIQKLPCLKSCSLCQFKKNFTNTTEGQLCSDEERGLLINEWRQSDSEAVNPFLPLLHVLLIQAKIDIAHRHHLALELIWTIYCPPATGLKKYKESLWMTPQIEGKDALKLARYHPEGTTYRDCLKKAVQDRISQYGKVILPTETGVRVREIDNVDLAMDFIDQLCVSKLLTLGLVEKAGIGGEKAKNKYS